MTKPSSILWDELNRLLVIGRLRQIMAEWWQIQLHFTDAKGFLQGVPKGKFFAPINPICKAITASNTGFSGCLSTVRQTTVESIHSGGTKISRCHAGLTTISLPIYIEGEFVGSVFADGFFLAGAQEEQKVALGNSLQRTFPGDDSLPQLIPEIPVLSEQDLTFLTRFIEIIVEEIISYQGALSQAGEEIQSLKSQLQDRYSSGNFIGKSPSMQTLYDLINRVCDSEATVLIQGENGTGKELIAKALHYQSKRAKENFIPVNCGAFNENLLESELFGHVKGSFTGAFKDKVGFFEAANQGTLFLDEIGDTSLTMQVKLLRFLQEGTFLPVGSTEVRSSNARVVCATNKDLEDMVQRGEFREDLYYRLNVINLRVPALRERKEDIPLLIEYFLEKMRQKSGSAEPHKSLSSGCLQVFMSYDWPGNVRELENELERLWVLSQEGGEIDLKWVSERITKRLDNTSALALALSSSAANQTGASLKETTKLIEKELIQEGLKRTKGNKSKLARELGISRASLIAKVSKYEL